VVGEAGAAGVEAGWTKKLVVGWGEKAVTGDDGAGVGVGEGESVTWASVVWGAAVEATAGAGDGEGKFRGANDAGEAVAVGAGDAGRCEANAVKGVGLAAATGRGVGLKTLGA